MAGVQCQTFGPRAVIRIDNPPVNALSSDIRVALADALDTAEADRAIAGVVLIGSERAFCGGADIRQFGTPAYWSGPRTGELAVRLESLAKPVLAALGGFAMGGGLELALAAHARLALRGTRLGLPEVHLGVIPAAGGIARLPRLVPAARALEMMMRGEPIPAEEAHAIGLIDRVVEGDLLAEAIAALDGLIAQGTPPARTLERPIREAEPGLVAAAAERYARRLPHDRARQALLACFEALLSRSPEETEAIVQSHSAALVESEDAKGRRHVFFGRRSVSRVPAMRGVAPRPVRRVGVRGNGERAEALRGALGALGLACPDEASADLVLDCAPSAAPAPAGAILAVEGLGRPAAGAIALALRGPDALPAIAEFAAAPDTPPDALAALVRLLGQLGAVAIPVRRTGACDRVWARLVAAAEERVAEGTAPGAVDDALAEWGFSRRVYPAAAPAPAGAQGEEIVRRCVDAAIDEGARLLDEGQVDTALAIDIGQVLGFGFPAHRGGPLFHAGRTGLGAVHARLEAHRARGLAVFQTLSPRIARLAGSGGSFE